MKSEPTRLLEDPRLSDTERSVFKVGQSQHSVAYDVTAGLTRFHANLAAALVPGAAAASGNGAGALGSTGKSALLGKLGLKAIVLMSVPAVGVAAGIALHGEQLAESRRPAVTVLAGTSTGSL